MNTIETDTRILVTGFEPYAEAFNASGALVQSLQDELPQELAGLPATLAFEVLDCAAGSREFEHHELERQLLELLQRYRPSVCIHTGQAPVYNKITVEKLATNSFLREVIDPARPAAYWSNLPGIDGLRSALESRGIPCGYSYYGGQHLCNHLLYSSLFFAEQNGTSHTAGFIHFPLLPEQLISHYRDAPCMPLSMTRKALSLIISHVVRDALPDGRRSDAVELSH